MKRILLVLILCQFYLWAASQEIMKNELDPYLKVERKETTWENLSVKFSSRLMFNVIKSDEKLYLQLGISDHGVFRVDEGDLIYLLLDNNESIPIACVRGGIADYHYNKYSSFWRGNFLYEINMEVRQKILSHHLKGVRISMGNTYDTYDNIKPKNAEKLQKAIQLVNSLPDSENPERTLRWRESFNNVSGVRVWSRFVFADTSAYIEMKVLHLKAKDGDRLLIYLGDKETISLTASDDTPTMSRATGRDYSFVRFYLSKMNLITLSERTFSKMVLSTREDKITDEGEDRMRSDFKADAEYMYNLLP